MPRPDRSAKTRFRMLDGLRFLAALMVMAYHYMGREQVFWGEPVRDVFPGVSPFAAYGALGVQLFFVISGFVILMSAEGRGIGAFVASRVSRLYPAYWFGVLATTALTVWIAPDLFDGVSLPQVLLNLTMTQEGFGVQSIDGVYWTLWIELLFYVLIALFLLAGITERRILVLAVAWPLAGAVAQLLAMPVAAGVLSASFSPLFATGMLIYLIRSRGHSRLRWAGLALTVLLAVYQTVTGFLAGTMSQDTERDLSPLVGAAIVLVLIGLVMLVTLTPLAARGPRWLVLAGALTYPVYLLHEHWGWWVLSWASPMAGKWGAVALAAGISIAAAALVERFVERPLRPLLSRGVKACFPRPAAAPVPAHEQQREPVLSGAR